MTKEQREELNIAWSEYIKNKPKLINLSYNSKRYILDFVESSIEKTERETRKELAGYFNLEVGEHLLKAGGEYVIIKKSYYDELKEVVKF